MKLFFLTLWVITSTTWSTSTMSPKDKLVHMIFSNGVYCSNNAKQTGCFVNVTQFNLMADGFAALLCSEKSVWDVDNKAPAVAAKCMTTAQKTAASTANVALEKCLNSKKTTFPAVMSKIAKFFNVTEQKPFAVIKAAATKVLAANKGFKCTDKPVLSVVYNLTVQFFNEQSFGLLLGEVVKLLTCPEVLCFHQTTNKIINSTNIVKFANAALKCNIKL